jgi:uncharacterized protein (TIGR03435 family)
MRSGVLWLITVLALFCGLGAHPEVQQAPDGPTFEVTSVKPNTSGPSRADTFGFFPGGHFRAVDAPLWRFIAEAYATTFQLAPFQIIGGPSWMRSDRFDAEAVAEGHDTRDEDRLMLQTLLRDRFKLLVHRESRQRPIYNLVKVSRDARLGPQLHRSAFDCAALRATQPFALIPAPAGQPRPCVMRFGWGQLAANGMTMIQLAEIGLSRYVNRPVRDRTGLEGPFDWTLNWSPDSFGTPNGAGSPPADPARPSLFTALQEQLGLELKSTKGPVDVVVVDHVERPTPN